jgi:hypothetical protein
MSPVVPRQSSICACGATGTAGWVYTFASCWVCAAKTVGAVATEPEIIATIARAMPILRIRVLPVCWEYAKQTVRRMHTHLKRLQNAAMADRPAGDVG